MRGREGEAGQIMVLSIVFGLLVLALVMVVGSVASVYLEHKQLLALADAIAADAADALDEGAYFGSDAGVLTLTDASVAANVEQYLDRAPAALVEDYEDLRVISPTGTPDGRSAQVSLQARIRPPLVPWALVPFADGFEVSVTASASAQ